MPNQESKNTKMTPEDHVKKLVNWVRHECKPGHPDLEENIVKGLKDGSEKLVKLLKDKCGIDHRQLKIAIDNTIKAIG